MINLTIDGRPVSVPKGTTVLDAAATVGIDIPALCHIDLKGTCVKNAPASCRICLVEVKRRREIGREVIEEMAGKVAALPRRRGVSIRTALVYEGHLAPIVEADGYFDAIVPFRRLLGL